MDGVVVINLDTRKDRFARVTKEMDRLGITARRFEAIREGEGILGCTLSHAACVRMMIEEGWNHVLICEDDLSFRVSRRQLDALIESFLGDRSAEVACFAFHLQSPPTPRNLLFFRTRDTQTTACYLVKRSIAPDLLATFEAGVDGLRRGGHRAEYGVDMVWKRLQTERVFVVPTIRVATQVPGYSDVMGLDMTYRV